MPTSPLLFEAKKEDPGLGLDEDKKLMPPPPFKKSVYQTSSLSKSTGYIFKKSDSQKDENESSQTSSPSSSLSSSMSQSPPTNDPNGVSEIRKSKDGVKKGLTKLFKKAGLFPNSEESVAVAAQWKQIVDEWEREAISEAEQWIKRDQTREKKWDANPLVLTVPSLALSLLDISCTKYGFNLEYGKEGVEVPEECELEEKGKHTNYYQSLFAVTEHLNFVGEDDILGPIILSMEGPAKEKEEKILRCILRTKKGDERVVVYRKADHPFPDTPEGKIKSLKLTATNIYNAKFHYVSNPQQQTELVSGLLNYEKQLIQKNYKFGVLYVKDEQKDENDFFNNVEPSPAFYEFLGVLGDKITLKGFDGFAGGLDTRTGRMVAGFLNY